MNISSVIRDVARGWDKTHQDQRNLLLLFDVRPAHELAAPSDVGNSKSFKTKTNSSLEESTLTTMVNIHKGRYCVVEMVG